LRTLRSFCLALLAVLLALPAVAAFETRATAAYVFDETTGTLLMAKNAEMPLPPASMSKLMTLNMLFEALRDGRVTMDTKFNVSARAHAMGGSSMFLTEADRPSVEELIKGIIVQSGNDACVVVAEGLAGTEEAFARTMNERALSLGMTNSTFSNSSGWPDPNQRMSMQDLGVLARRLISDFPEYYGFFGLTSYAYDGRVPTNHGNRNPLLKLGIGADGLKTGHTSEAGFGLVGSAVQGDRRVVFVITGLNTDTERAEEAERIVNWAFRQFIRKTIVTEGTRLTDVPVWIGAQERVGLVASKDFELLVPALVRGEVEGEISYNSPLIAPIKKGEVIGKLLVSLDGMAPVELPLVAERDVPKGGFVAHLRTATRVLMRDAEADADADATAN
jgi:D-alanyl-D-alanine carboxypeptidase (penicillin-binding protein 5/6)